MCGSSPAQSAFSWDQPASVCSPGHRFSPGHGAVSSARLCTTAAPGTPLTRAHLLLPPLRVPGALTSSSAAATTCVGSCHHLGPKCVQTSNTPKCSAGAVQSLLSMPVPQVGGDQLGAGGSHAVPAFAVPSWGPTGAGGAPVEVKAIGRQGQGEGALLGRRAIG